MELSPEMLGVKVGRVTNERFMTRSMCYPALFTKLTLAERTLFRLLFMTKIRWVRVLWIKHFNSLLSFCPGIHFLTLISLLYLGIHILIKSSPIRFLAFFLNGLTLYGAYLLFGRSKRVILLFGLTKRSTGKENQKYE